MRQDIKLKGKLKGYTQTPLQLTLLFAAMDVWMYVLNVKAGILGTIFVAIYFLSCCLSIGEISRFCSMS